MPWWIIIICIFLLSFVIGYFLYIGKRKKGIQRYKKNNMYQELPVQKIEYDIPSEIFNFLTEIEVDGKKYYLSTSCFLPLIDGTKIKEDVEKSSVKTMKVWIDPKNLSLFEMDIKSYLEKIYPSTGKSSKLEVLGTGYSLKEDYYETKV